MNVLNNEVMKKEYIKPLLNIVRVNGEMMLAASGVSGKIGDSPSIGYGGVDEEGTLDAEVKGNPFGDSIFE